MREKVVQLLRFKKNLRVNDNVLLSEVNPKIPVIGVYFFEKEILQSSDFSDFHLKFVIDSLIELEKNLKKLGIPLLFIESELPEGFDYLRDNFNIISVFSHEETGNYKTYIRDIRVRKYFEKSKIPFYEYPNNGVVRGLENRDKWINIRNYRMNKNIFYPYSNYKSIQPNNELENNSKKVLEKYSNKIDNYKNIQTGGEKTAKHILKDFLQKRSSGYHFNISKPLESMDSCSRLSPYISTGCISIKYIYQKSLEHIRYLRYNGTGGNNIKGINFFLSRIHRQSHFIQKLEDQPEIEWKNINPNFDSIRKETDWKLINTVFNSQSGIPIIDAIVKQLYQTGWTSFRSRAMLVSFICNTCMQPWQSIKDILARLFTDYEPGIHYYQMQMQAGTTGINTIRIYNPVLNGEKKDPYGKFIRNYIPELRDLPIEFVHNPSRWYNFSTINYPYPIVDIQTSNKYARKQLRYIKKNTSKFIKGEILKKHSRRKNANFSSKKSYNQRSLF